MKIKWGVDGHYDEQGKLKAYEADLTEYGYEEDMNADQVEEIVNQAIEDRHSQGPERGLFQP